MRSFTKEEVSGIEKKDLPSLSPQLGNQSRLLGHTAKGIPKSAARLDLAHHIIGVDDTEFDLRLRLKGRDNKEDSREGGKANVKERAPFPHQYPTNRFD